jgi:hypothetical protein
MVALAGLTKAVDARLSIWLPRMCRQNEKALVNPVALANGLGLNPRTPRARKAGGSGRKTII